MLGVEYVYHITDIIIYLINWGGGDFNSEYLCETVLAVLELSL